MPSVSEALARGFSLRAKESLDFARGERGLGKASGKHDMTDQPAMTATREKPAWTVSGYLMLLVFLVLAGVMAVRFLGFVAADAPDDQAPGFVFGTFAGIVVL